MKEKIIAIIAQVLGVDAASIDEETSPDTLESWDSLKHMNMVLALEEAFGIAISEEQIVEMLNVALVIQVVKEQTGGVEPA